MLQKEVSMSSTADEPHRNRLIEKIFTLLSPFSVNIPEQYRHEIYGSLLQTNIRRISFFALLLFFSEILLYIIEDRLFNTGGVIFAFLVSNILTLPLLWFTRLKIAALPLVVPQMVQVLYTLTLLAFGAGVSLYAQTEMDLVHIYIMMVFGAAFFVHMKPWISALLLLVIYVPYVLILPVFQPDSNVVFVISINTGISNFMAWLLGITTLKTKVNSLQSTRKIEEKNALLADLIKKDSMTGLLSHKASFQKLNEEISRAARIGYPLSLIIADIDDFKQVNDRYGHIVGDQVIIQFSQALSEIARSTDSVGRYGGEEFIIIMPDTDLQGAVILSERILTEIRSLVLPLDAAITLSGGMSQYSGEASDEFIRKTDQRLYRAKAEGKNRFVST
jgi:diguanylate cyclase (GGDEF)-like protein